MTKEATYSIVELPLEQIEPDPRNIRRRADAAQIDKLRQSLLAALGRGEEYHNPITVYQVGRNRYRIKFGHRRFYAAQAVVGRLHFRLVGRPTDSQLILDQLDESLHQEELNDIDIGWALRRYQEATNSSIGQLQSKVEELGLSRDATSKPSKFWVKFHLDLTRLSEELQGLLAEGSLSATTAWQLRSLPAPKQRELADRIVREGLSAREVEHLLHADADSEPVGPLPALPSADDFDLLRPEFAQTTIRELVAQAGEEAGDQRDRGHRVINPAHRSSPVTVTYQYPNLDVDLRRADETTRQIVQMLDKDAWLQKATESQRAVARDAILWGKRSVAEAIALAEHFVQEWPDADHLVQQTLVTVRRMLDASTQRPPQGAVSSLLQLYLEALSQRLSAEAVPA